jgi:hypothetical protein
MTIAAQAVMQGHLPSRNMAFLPRYHPSPKQSASTRRAAHSGQQAGTGNLGSATGAWARRYALRRWHTYACLAAKAQGTTPLHQWWALGIPTRAPACPTQVIQGMAQVPVGDWRPGTLRRKQARPLHHGSQKLHAQSALRQRHKSKKRRQNQCGPCTPAGPSKHAGASMAGRLCPRFETRLRHADVEEHHKNLPLERPPPPPVHIL